MLRSRRAWSGPVSRRSLLAGAAAGPFLSRAFSQTNPILAYAGSYSSPQGPEGSKGRGQGIYLCEMNPQTGALKQREVFEDASNPSWLALHPSRRFLYAANETATFEGSAAGSASAFAVDRATGRLTLLNRVSSQGAGPAHLSVHPSGKFVLVANYAGGTLAVLPVEPNGRLGAAVDVIQDKGTPGSAKATSAPPGSFAISGHERPHAHMIQADPSGRFVLSTDLALDKIFVWKFDSGKLRPNDPPLVALPSGDGPRHFAFHPNGRWVYLLGEESSTIVVFDYQASEGRLTMKQTLSTLPKGFVGTNFTSEVVVSADGRFVYAANRLHDSIARFAVGKDGSLTYLGETWTRGDYPRNFTIDPSGNFLYSCNQRSDAIAVFRVNRETADLTFTGQYVAVGTPAIVVFLS
jgi:6-phosphogluconolactonase